MYFMPESGFISKPGALEIRICEDTAVCSAMFAKLLGFSKSNAG